MRKMFLAAAAATAMISSVAYAAVIFDAATGIGFVGKGDVQLIYGWNNKQLQDNADQIRFRANSVVVTEQTWECRNSHNENIQERARTTTTSVEGLVTTVARERNQITGFNLTGYSGNPTVVAGETEGPKLNSCPAQPSTWYLSVEAGDPVVVEEESGTLLEVSRDLGATWTSM